MMESGTGEGLVGRVVWAISRGPATIGRSRAERRQGRRFFFLILQTFCTTVIGRGAQARWSEVKEGTEVGSMMEGGTGKGLVGWVVWPISRERAAIGRLREEERAHGTALRGTLKGLMDHDASIGKGTALAEGTDSEVEGTHRGGLTDAEGCDGALDVLDGIVDGKASSHDAAGEGRG
ncbi:hypothetical protein COCNU_contig69400151G000010 [Cocos nucifera]|nr:hypothetical protein [Cocos nucifera]